jgi:hypothetical protein
MGAVIGYARVSTDRELVLVSAIGALPHRFAWRFFDRAALAPVIASAL